MKKILVAGASGFIGRSLINELLESEVEIIALSRNERVSHHPRLTWKRCDLFSLKDITEAMAGSEEAYYLVHSMLPSASLSQGHFYDYDLIMADNFIRAAKYHKLSHLIYLGGIVPYGEELSWHLRSRLEVEKTFQDSGILTTVFRAGLIIGPQGSSFTIIKKLIERLPVMICPAWTKVRTQPIALRDVIRVLKKTLFDKSIRGKIYEIGGPEILTYQELISRAAKKFKKGTWVFSSNIIPLSLSGWWITLVTGVSKNLVYPLVLSLKHEMIVQKDHSWPFPSDLSTKIDDVLNESLKVKSSGEHLGHVSGYKDVRSVQRLILPEGRDAKWVAEEYFRWLPAFFSSLVKVGIHGDYCTFYLINPKLQILVLEKSRERSSSDRQLLYVVGGLLSAGIGRGRLEFREVLGRKFIIAALHEFNPSLPWPIYRFTQAIVHLIVMKAFAEHLKWHVISAKKVLL